MEEIRQPLFAAVCVDANKMADVLLENSLKVSEDRISLQEIIDRHNSCSTDESADKSNI